MYRILIATKRGKYEYENTYKWYSKKEKIEDEEGKITEEKIVIKEYDNLKDAHAAVIDLMKDPCPCKDYSYNDLVVVDYKEYDVSITSV